MEFRVLGPLEVVGPGGPIEIGSVGQRVILALLVLGAGTTVASERLVDELWGDDPTPTATHGLQVHVSGLRRALGPGHVQRQGRGYRLRADEGAIDLARFEAVAAEAAHRAAAGDPAGAADGYAAALALWRGPASRTSARGTRSGPSGRASTSCGLA